MILTIFFMGIALFFIILSIDMARCYIKLSGYNQSPLTITTWDGRHSPYHPSVLYFKNSWNGWHYWMVETPFYKKGKPYIDYWECPSIHVSNDGIHWTEPTNNPIVTLTAKECEQMDYYSDPHLVLTGGVWSVGTGSIDVMGIRQKTMRYSYYAALAKTVFPGLKAKRSLIVQPVLPTTKN